MPALHLYWGLHSQYCWRVRLALEHKGLAYESHCVLMDQQEHQSPHMLKLNPRGRVPVLKCDDYVEFESVAILYYLDLKFPQAPIFGHDPEETGVIVRVIEEYQTYSEPSLLKITRAVAEGTVLKRMDELTDAMHVVAREARTIEGRLSKADWIVGDAYSAADMVVYPAIHALRHALTDPSAAELAARFLPMETNYPALARWMTRIQALPGYARTCPTEENQTKEAS
jgi:glutathione S-transferase